MTSYQYNVALILLAGIGFVVQVVQLLFRNEKKWYKRITRFGWFVFCLATIMVVVGILGVNASDDERRKSFVSDSIKNVGYSKKIEFLEKKIEDNAKSNIEEHKNTQNKISNIDTAKYPILTPYGLGDYIYSKDSSTFSFPFGIKNNGGAIAEDARVDFQLIVKLKSNNRYQILNKQTIPKKPRSIGLTDFFSEGVVMHYLEKYYIDTIYIVFYTTCYSKGRVFRTKDVSIIFTKESRQAIIDDLDMHPDLLVYLKQIGYIR